MISSNLHVKLHMMLMLTIITFELSSSCHVSTENFTARSSIWRLVDISTRVCKELYTLTSAAGYTQLIYKSTLFFKRGSSCINLKFCNIPGFICEYEIDQSRFQTYHHIIIFAIINHKILLRPNYNREVWDYKNTNVDRMKKYFSLQLEKCF